jgi:quinol-cytochrome oxidoreductase complex cytochrome b subunit
MVLVFNFTGYLLPWDQLAYWAITVSTSLISYIPLAGPEVSRFVLGSSQVGQGALSNFYALHVAVLPVIMALALSYHFWKVRKDGGISQPLSDEAEGRRLSTIPHLVQREFAAAVAIFTAVVFWAMLVPAPLGELANPAQSPNPAKAAWYFAGLQELLLHMHALAAMALVGLVLAGLALLPHWDRHEQTVGIYFRSARGRRAALLGAILALDLVPVLVILDEFWIDITATLPAWPNLVSGGLVPLLLTLAGLAVIYAAIRLVLKANRAEGLVGLYSFIMISLVILTLIGVYFRGPNMALVLPF